jgi:hypothetical protein
MIEPAAGRVGPKSEAGFSGMFKRFTRIAASTVLAVGVMGGLGVQTVAAYGTPIACSSPATGTPFARFGDYNRYFLVSNGNFENGSSDWALSNGALVVRGNEPWKVAGGLDSRNLQLPYNATAESRTVCVSRNQNILRLFAYNQHVSGSILHIEAWAQASTGGYWAVTAFDVNGDANPVGYSPTIQLQIPNQFGGTGTENLYLKFTTRGAPATWWIDDVFLDPFKTW